MLSSSEVVYMAYQLHTTFLNSKISKSPFQSNTQSDIQKEVHIQPLESHAVFTKNLSIVISIFSVYKKIGHNQKKHQEPNSFITINLFILMIENHHIKVIKKLPLNKRNKTQLFAKTHNNTNNILKGKSLHK